MDEGDFYCSVSGGCHFYGTEEFFNRLSFFIDRDAESDPEDDFTLKSLPDTLQKGLHYSFEDVESSIKFVLFCPCEIFEDGTMIRYTDVNDPHPSEYTESTITEVFNIFSGDSPSLGDYEDIDGEVFSVVPSGHNLIVTYTSYLILKQASPEIKPHILYGLAFGGNRGTMGEIDYGPAGRIFGQHVAWEAICDNIEKGFEDPITFWRQLLGNKEREDEDILHDAWKGPGNMWVFVRPDRFPIKETLAAPPIPDFPYLVNLEATIQKFKPTFTSLPSDIILFTCEFLPIRSIYTLITTCKIIRAIIMPHANAIARRRLIEDEPWYLPAGPFKLNSTKTDRKIGPYGIKEVHGREEIQWWAEQWTAGGISEEDMDAKIPWFIYRKECSKSMSMWNRKRIWGISRQLDALARAKGLL